MAWSCVLALRHAARNVSPLSNLWCRTRFGDAPLHFAAQIGNLVAAEVMLENGAYVDIPNKYVQQHTFSMRNQSECGIPSHLRVAAALYVRFARNGCL